MALATPTDSPSDAASPLISVSRVSKVFGRTRALADVSLDVAAGSCAVLSGANGSGKSTLLKIVATVMSPTDGEASVVGCSTLKEAESVRRETGVLLHEPSVYPDLTVRENLELFGRLARLDDLGARIVEVIGDLQLASFADTRCRALSHGLRKRAGLAVATLHAPKVLLLDEPATGLDAESVDYVVGLIDSVRQRGGCCLVASHQPGFANRVGTDFYRLTRGELAPHR